MDAHEIITEVARARSAIKALGLMPTKFELAKDAFDDLAMRLIKEKAPPTPGRDFMLGIPVYVSDDVPYGVVRIYKTDGTVEDVGSADGSP